MMLDFHKIRRLPPYVFEQVNVTKAGLRAGGADVIDLGMGNPDLPTPPHIVEKLRAAVTLSKKAAPNLRAVREKRWRRRQSSRRASRRASARPISGWPSRPCL